MLPFCGPGTADGFSAKICNTFKKITRAFIPFFLQECIKDAALAAREDFLTWLLTKKQLNYDSCYQGTVEKYFYTYRNSWDVEEECSREVLRLRAAAGLNTSLKGKVDLYTHDFLVINNFDCFLQLRKRIVDFDCFEENLCVYCTLAQYKNAPLALSKSKAEQKEIALHAHNGELLEYFAVQKEDLLGVKRLPGITDCFFYKDRRLLTYKLMVEKGITIYASQPIIYYSLKARNVPVVRNYIPSNTLFCTNTAFFLLWYATKNPKAFAKDVLYREIVECFCTICTNRYTWLIRKYLKSFPVLFSYKPGKATFIHALLTLTYKKDRYMKQWLRHFAEKRLALSNKAVLATPKTNIVPECW